MPGVGDYVTINATDVAITVNINDTFVQIGSLFLVGDVTLHVFNYATLNISMYLVFLYLFLYIFLYFSNTNTTNAGYSLTWLGESTAVWVEDSLVISVDIYGNSFLGTNGMFFSRFP